MVFPWEVRVRRPTAADAISSTRKKENPVGISLFSSYRLCTTRAQTAPWAPRLILDWTVRNRATLGVKLSASLAYEACLTQPHCDGCYLLEGAKLIQNGKATLDGLSIAESIPSLSGPQEPHSGASRFLERKARLPRLIFSLAC